MLQKWPQWWDEFIDLIQTSSLKLRLIVPNEIVDELKKHIESDGEQSLSARVARKRLAQLVDMDCEEPSLSKLEVSQSSKDIGADSIVDRKLIAYAISLAEAATTKMVFVATDDGGIMLDIARYNRKAKDDEKSRKEKEQPSQYSNIDFVRAIAAKGEFNPVVCSLTKESELAKLIKFLPDEIKLSYKQKNAEPQNTQKNAEPQNTYCRW